MQCWRLVIHPGSICVNTTHRNIRIAQKKAKFQVFGGSRVES